MRVRGNNKRCAIGCRGFVANPPLFLHGVYGDSLFKLDETVDDITSERGR